MKKFGWKEWRGRLSKKKLVRYNLKWHEDCINDVKI